jgi:glycosyltransferase involved in cell wall biosynthesis
VPVVTTVHDVLWLTKPRWLRPSGLTGPIIALACRRYVSDALRRSARIIAPSEATRRSIEEVAPEAAERLRVIPNGVDEAFGPLDPTDQQGVRRVRDTCARLLGGAWRFVLDVGRAAAYRNHAGLVRAFASAFRSDSTVHLVLVQAIGEQATSSTKLAARLGIEGRVHVASGVASRDLVALYQGAICLCHPSLHESFGTVVAEAMACGCPVITSGRAASGEVAEGVAQLVNPEHEDEIAAAMKRVAYEPGVADRMRARGLDRAERISARATAAATWQVYRELLGTAS